MIFSHSKINLVLEDPYSYFLNYVCKVQPIAKSPALLIGSAVHYGIEHETFDLDSYFKENGSFNQKNTYSLEQAISESLTQCYLDQKDEIIKGIVGDSKIISLEKEVKLETEVDKNGHQFMGIIDLLILTDKGYIVVDYKTTSQTPKYEQYLDQLYRYSYLIKRTKTKPIYKFAIIGLKKPLLRQKQNETIEQFRNRLVLDYREKFNQYVTYKVYEENEIYSELFNKKTLEDYYNNLEDLMDMAFSIIQRDIYPINYSKAFTVYGPSQFYDFIYWDSEKLLGKYEIRDLVYDQDLNELKQTRPLLESDLEIIKQRSTYQIEEHSIITFDKYLKSLEEPTLHENIRVDPILVKLYDKTIEYIKSKE